MIYIGAFVSLIVALASPVGYYVYHIPAEYMKTTAVLGGFIGLTLIVGIHERFRKRYPN